MSLSVRQLSVRQGAHILLDGVAFDAAAGRVLGVVGPNGAGKSTLLGALAGICPVAAGTIAFDGAPLPLGDPRALAASRAIMTQHFDCAFDFSVAEIVALGRAAHAGTPRCRNDAAAVAAGLRTADIGHLAERPVPRLSGGERQRVAFAKLVAQAHDSLAEGRPYLVLLDEPVASLDPRHQHAVLGAARSMADRGATVLVTLHELSLASIYADDIIVLDRARVVDVGPAGDILTPGLVERVFGVRTAPAAWGMKTILHAVPQESVGRIS